MCASVGRCAFFSFLIHIVWSKGFGSIGFNRNAVYSGEPVMLTCTYESGILISAAVSAQNGSSFKGWLICHVNTGDITAMGVFAGLNFFGCPSIISRLKSVSLTLTAMPSMELDYNCALKVFDGNSLVTLTSERFVSLKVLVCPLMPKFQRNLVAINEDNDYSTIRCDSPNGKPPAQILLTIISRGGKMLTVRNTDVAVLVVPSPLLEWHNALVTCNVTNHKCTNISATTYLFINHMKLKRHPVVVNTEATFMTLDCSAYITGYPGVRYIWNVPGTCRVNDICNRSGPLLNVFQGQSGLYNCTATNNVTARSITVVIPVISATTTTITATAAKTISTTIAVTAVMVYQPASRNGLIIGVVLGIVLLLFLAVILVLLCKRENFSKGFIRALSLAENLVESSKSQLTTTMYDDHMKEIKCNQTIESETTMESPTNFQSQCPELPKEFPNLRSQTVEEEQCTLSRYYTSRVNWSYGI